jgi:hypothetical protein
MHDKIAKDLEAIGATNLDKWRNEVLKSYELTKKLEAIQEDNEKILNAKILKLELEFDKKLAA